MNGALAVAAAFGLEAAVGYPDALHARLPHPVAWVARLLSAFERAWNRPGLPRRLLGAATMAITAAVTGLIGLAFAHVGWVVIVLAGAAGLASRSLYDHVRDVLRPLEQGDIAQARAMVARIVGRDVESLDEAGVAAAALESLAESFNDGVVAPVFWFLIAGLPGLFVYKAVNTADSMIGHREERWRAFGWAAARADDVMNLIPARLAGALIVLCGRGGWRIMWRDAPKHASPNAGWPESAMAGALQVRLGGPARYDDVVHDRAVLGEGAAPNAGDLRRGLGLYVRACAVLWLAIVGGGLAWQL